MSDVNETMIGTRGIGRYYGNPEVNILGRKYTRPATTCNLGKGADGKMKYCVLDNAQKPEAREESLKALRVLAAKHKWVDPKEVKKATKTKVVVNESA